MTCEVCGKPRRDPILLRPIECECTPVSKLRERIHLLRHALTEWLVSTPTDSSGKYHPINHYEACRAQEALAKDDQLACI